MAEYTMEELFEMNKKYLDDESIKFEGIDDFEEYYYERCKDFFDASYEDVKKLVGKVFMSPSGSTLVKVLGVRDDTDNKYWNSCKLWTYFIYEELSYSKDGDWWFDDWSYLQEYDDVAKFRITPYADMNIASESMYHIGKDGNLYVDYGCDSNYEKFVEVDPTCFDIARAEAVKEDVR